MKLASPFAWNPLWACLGRNIEHYLAHRYEWTEQDILMSNIWV